MPSIRVKDNTTLLGAILDAGEIEMRNEFLELEGEYKEERKEQTKIQRHLNDLL